MRIHSDNRAAELAASINAQAFTHGRDVYFGADRYKPETSEGKRLLAHELVHVEQQGRNSKNVQRQIYVGEDKTASEQDMKLTTSIPRPSGLPLMQCFILQEIPNSAEAVRQIPENQLYDIEASLLLDHQPGNSQVFDSKSSSLGGASAAVGGNLLSSSSQAFKNGFITIPTTGNAIGFIAFPRSLGGAMPGHTALVAVLDGEMVSVGFRPASNWEALFNFRGLFQEGKGEATHVLGKNYNESAMFKNPSAKQIMWELTPEVAAKLRAASSKSELRAVIEEIMEAQASRYTGRVTEIKTPGVTNCVGAACGAFQNITGEAPRAKMPSGQIELIFPEGGTLKPQGRMLGGMDTAQAVGGNEPVVAKMPRKLKIMRYGGRVFLVAGIAWSGYEIYKAVDKGDYRTATQEVGGFVAGAAAGAALGLFCGPGAPVCSVVLGLVGGVAGTIAGREVSGVIYDELSDDDDDVRDWLSAHSLEDVRGLSTEAKISAIKTLMGGWISDEDVAAICNIARSVKNKAEADKIRNNIDVLEMSSIGQRTMVRVCFSKMP